jgi:hypothetical protein
VNVNCLACGRPLPEKALGDEDNVEPGDGGREAGEPLPDGAPPELGRFCRPCRDLLKDAD